MFKFIDLFCGIGGFHQALTKIGGVCVFACDIDLKCREIYEKNYNIKPESDITEVDIHSIPEFEVLCAGFPCQPFSKAGYQKGFDDDRGNLFFSICKIIERHKPKYLLMENVKNLVSHDNGNTWKTIYKHITELGYNTYSEPLVLNVLHFDIPQNRERVLILAKRMDLGEWNLAPVIPPNPKQQLHRTLEHFIIEPEKVSQKYFLSGKMKSVSEIWNEFIQLLIQNHIECPKFPIWTDWWDQEVENEDPFYQKYTNWIDKNQAFYGEYKQQLDPWLKKSRSHPHWIGAVRKLEWQAGDLQPSDSMNTVLWTARGSGIRVKRCDYIPSLVAMSQIPIYGPQSRKLTPLELLRLQSFPDTFIFDEKQIYKQLGNAVNITMIEKCARFLLFNENLFDKSM